MEPHQLDTTTHPNRYPGILQALAHACLELGLAPKKMLSFGCSRGFEPLDLHAVFPDAEIHGCEISQPMLEEAKERCKPHGIPIFESTVRNLNAHGPYDLILAMSVLCRHPVSHMVDDISEVYPFAAFCSAVVALDAALAEGGVVVIYNSNYFFEDSTVSHRYSPVATPLEENGFVDRFLPDGRKLYRREMLVGEQTLPLHVIDIRFPRWRETLAERRRLVALGSDARLVPHMAPKEAVFRDLRTIVWQKHRRADR